MSLKSAIEWTISTWNPVTGCTKVSAGCDQCYAERFSERFRGVAGHPFESGFDLTLRDRCREQRVLFFFKQWGGRTPKAGGNTLDGRQWQEYPDMAYNRVLEGPLRVAGALVEDMQKQLDNH